MNMRLRPVVLSFVSTVFGLSALAAELPSGKDYTNSIGMKLLCTPDPNKKFGGGVVAGLSLDGGQTWKHVRHVPAMKGYLSVAQAPNGVIYLFGSRTSCAAFNEAWLMEGKPLK